MVKRAQGASTVEAGSVVAVPLPSGAYGIVWMLDTQAAFRFLVMEGFWPSLPSEAELAAARPARSSDDDVWKGWFQGKLPKDFTVVGRRRLPPSVRALARPEGTMIFQSGEDLRSELHREWRMVHDRPALEAEWAAAEAAEAARVEARRRTRTLPRMLRERPFAHWADRWPAKVLREARRIFRDATAELIALGEQATKAQRKAILRRIVTELNTLDADGEGCLESVERDELVARIEELASLVGLDNDDEALTGHRDW